MNGWNLKITQLKSSSKPPFWVPAVHFPGCTLYIKCETAGACRHFWLGYRWGLSKLADKYHSCFAVAEQMLIPCLKAGHECQRPQTPMRATRYHDKNMYEIPHYEDFARATWDCTLSPLFLGMSMCFPCG